MSAAEPPSRPDPNRDTHVAFPDLEGAPARPTPTDPPAVARRPRLSHTTAFPGGRRVRRSAAPVRPPGTGGRWGGWVAGAAVLAVLLGFGGGVHVGVGDGASVVSVGAGPEFGDGPGMDSGFVDDSGDAPAADPEPAFLGAWVELADAPPIGGTAPLTGRARQVHPVPADVRQLRVEVVGDGPAQATTAVTVEGRNAVDPLDRGLPWVAEAAVDGAADPTVTTRVQVDVQSPAGTGTLECRIYAGGTLVALDTGDTAVTCTASVPARQR